MHRRRRHLKNRVLTALLLRVDDRLDRLFRVLSVLRCHEVGLLVPSSDFLSAIVSSFLREWLANLADFGVLVILGRLDNTDEAVL